MRVRTRALTLVAVVAVSACKREEPEPAGDSLAALEAEWPPHTPTCHAWTADDLAAVERLPEGPHVAAFDHVWRTVAEKHYDPTLACLDWIALREHYGKQVAAASDAGALPQCQANSRLGLSRCWMVQSMKCGMVSPNAAR